MWFLSTTIIISLVSIYFLYQRKYKWIFMLTKAFLRDVRTFYILMHVYVQIWYKRRCNGSVVGEFSALAKKHPLKVAFVFEDSSWTFGQAENFINKIANYFEGQGFAKGDTIGLLLENRPEYPCIWLGLSKIGVVTTLLDGKLLKHAIKVTNCKALIFGSNHAHYVSDALNQLTNIKLYQFREAVADTRKNLPNTTDLKLQLLSLSNNAMCKSRQSPEDTLLHVFKTDGTSGVPMVTCITNIRFMYMCYHSQMYANLTASDLLYVPLPLFNSLGGIIGIGQTLLIGSATVIRKQFSPEQFWKDCERYRCTVAMYMDHMCQSVLYAPYSEHLTHRVKTLLGVGMKAEIWENFVNKFSIKHVCELFGGGEDAFLLGNFDNMLGAAGSIPLFMRPYFPIALISYSHKAKQPVRKENGYCVRAKPNEIGLMIAKVDEGNTLFFGDAEAVIEDKFICDVFASGDRYIRMDCFAECNELGYVYHTN